MLKGTEQTVVNAQGKSVQKLVSGERVEFAYDAAGLRVQKEHSKVTATGSPTTVQVVTTDYFLHGKLVMHLKKTTTTETVDADGNVTASVKVSTDQMHIFYDAQSRPAMVNFNGTLYTYVHNLQGDIIGIVDSTGTKVVGYGYDAWGKPISDPWSLTTEYQVLAGLNPFRYRGYVWDQETELYYLRSRYYDPRLDRFITADTEIGEQGAVLSHNLYAYCEGNPVKKIDIDGKRPIDMAGYYIISEYRRPRIFPLYIDGNKREWPSGVNWGKYLMDHKGYYLYIRGGTIRYNKFRKLWTAGSKNREDKAAAVW